MFLRRSSARPVAQRGLHDAHTLADAAASALDTARREGLPLLSVAEREAPGREQYWFAGNMLHVATVYGVGVGAADHERISREALSGLTLGEDMTTLYADEGESEAAYTDLRVTKDDFKRYLRWIKTVY